MTAIFSLPRQQPVAGDVALSSGQIALRAYPAATLEFYLANTSTPVDVYSNAARSTTHTWPVVADSTGKFPVIYLPAGVTMDVVLKTSTGATIDTYEDVPGDEVATSGNASVIGRGNPVGTIQWHSLQEVPAGWLRIKRDPQALSKSEYPELNAKYAAQSYPYGSTTTTFNIPGGAGLFPMIWDDSSTYDPDAATRLDHATALSEVGNLIGSRQLSQNKQHTHDVTGQTEEGTGTVDVRQHNDTFGLQAGSVTQCMRVPVTEEKTVTVNPIDVDITSQPEGGTVARPNNVAFPFIIFVSPSAAATTHASLGMPYLFNDSTSDADPGAGYVSFDNASIADASFMYVSKSDVFGAAVGDMWEEINSVPGARRAVVNIYNSGSMANSIGVIVTAGMTNGTTYWKIPVSVKSFNGSFADDAYLAVSLSLSGPASETSSNVTTYTVGNLPGTPTAGLIAFATNGRKNGEGAGSGTGVLVFADGTAWRACDTGATVES